MNPPDVESLESFFCNKWYYFGRCTPYPVQITGIPNRPFKAFNTKEECQKYINKELKRKFKSND